MSRDRGDQDEIGESVAGDAAPPPEPVEPSPIDTIEDRLPPGHLAKIEQRVGIVSHFFGPIPPPAVLNQYDEIVPGAAARIIKLAEKETAARISLAKQVTSSELRRLDRGLWVGFAVVMTAIAVGGILVAFGHEAAGAAIAAVPSTGLVGVFVYGKVTQPQKRGVDRKKVRKKFNDVLDRY